MQISLKKKKLSSGKFSWYIEFYDGSYVDKNGTMKHNRSFEYLKLYTLQEPQTAIDKKKDKETIQLANQILSIRKSEYFQGKHSIKNDKKSKTRFLDYYKQLKNERNDSKGNYGNWDAAGKHLERYCSPTLTFDNVDDEFAKGFRRFLDSKSVTKSGIALSQNSKYTYFNKFKAALRQAFEDGFLTDDITKKIKSFDQGESQREYLVHSELQL